MLIDTKRLYNTKYHIKNQSEMKVIFKTPEIARINNIDFLIIE